MASVARASFASEPDEERPTVYEPDEKRPIVYERVDEKKLYGFEQRARERFVTDPTLDELFLLGSSSSAEMLLFDPARWVYARDMIVLEIYGNRGIVRTSAEEYDEDLSEREATAQEIAAVRKFITKNNVDELPKLSALRMVQGESEPLTVASGTTYLYLHLTSRTGKRVLMRNPPSREDDLYPADDPLRRYRSVVDLFEGLKTGR